MDHVVVFEAAHHVDDCVHLADVGQKLVAKTLSLAGPLHQPGDIDKLHPGGNDLLAGAKGSQLIEPGVWHGDHTRIRLNRAEGVVGGFGLGVGDQGIEQGRFADVWQTDDSGFKHG